MGAPHATSSHSISGQLCSQTPREPILHPLSKGDSHWVGGTWVPKAYSADLVGHFAIYPESWARAVVS